MIKLFSLLFCFLLFGCIKQNKNSVYYQKKVSLKKQNINNTILDSKDLFNPFLYKINDESILEEQEKIKCSRIESGFFESIFTNTIDNQNEKQYDHLNEEIMKRDISTINIDLIKLQTKLKIKDRNKNICVINDKITITPKMTIITDKKRKASLILTFKF